MEQYFREGIAQATGQVYTSAKRRFLQFCTRAKLAPLPLSELLLCRYVSFLASEGLSPRTIKCYLSALRHLQVAQHMGDPRIGDMPRLEQVLKGIKRQHAKKSPPQRPRLPMTPEVLAKIKAIWGKDPSKFDHAMLWAACCLCYFAFLRSGEITVPSESAYDSSTHLNMGDVSVDSVVNPSVVKVQIKASKTDQFRRGVAVYVGRTDNDLCPVAAILAYIARRGTDSGFFFRFEDGRLLTKDRFVAAVRRALSKAGIDASAYSGHSFRIGAATTAGKKGVSAEKIKTLGRWESAAYLLYLRLSREDLTSVSSIISQS